VFIAKYQWAFTVISYGYFTINHFSQSYLNARLNWSFSFEINAKLFGFLHTDLPYTKIKKAGERKLSLGNM